MIALKILITMAVGLSAAACSTTYAERQAANPYRATSSEQACVDYGFRAGTDAYNRCVVRESQARALGRAPVDYTAVRIADDARAACASYGLTPASYTWDRCVGRETDARRYRDTAYVTPPPAYPATYPTTTTYYASGYPASTTVTYTTPAYVPPATTPPAGVEAFRDEYGFRYDGQGNRLDRYGNIISPQSTTR